LMHRSVMASTNQWMMNYLQRGLGQGHVTLFPNWPLMLCFVVPLFVVVMTGQTAGIAFTQMLFFRFFPYKADSLHRSR